MYNITILLMCASSALFSLFLLRQRAGLFNAAQITLWLGFASWTLELLFRYLKAGTLPVYDLKSSLFFWGWCGILVYLICQMRFKLMVLGAFVSLVGLLIAAISGTLAETRAYLNPQFRGLWFHVHVISMFLGIAMFLLSSLAATLYLWVDRVLKTKRMNTLYQRLPSLGGLDQIGYYSVNYGFPLYSLGMISGLLYSGATFGRYWQWDPKEVWALITWIMYAVLIHERLALGWKGKKAAMLTIFCFLVLLFTYLGISHLDLGYHSFKTLSGGS